MNPSETRELMGDIRRIRDLGLTILLIEHDMRLVQGICSRVVAFDHGVKITEGSFAEVRNHPAVIEAYLGHRAASPPEHGAAAARQRHGLSMGRSAR